MVQGCVDWRWFVKEDGKSNLELVCRFENEIAVRSVLWVGELGFDDGLNGEILGCDAGLRADGAAVVFEQVVETLDDYWEVWTGVDGFVFRIEAVGNDGTLCLEVSGDLVDDGRVWWWWWWWWWCCWKRRGRRVMACRVW